MVALVAAIGAGLLVHGRSSSSTLTGQVAPDFRLPDLRDTSRTVSLASLRGRPVVLKRMEDLLAPLPPSQRAGTAWAEARLMADEDVALNESIGRHGLALIRREIPFFTAADREKILGRNAAELWRFSS